MVLRASPPVLPPSAVAFFFLPLLSSAAAAAAVYSLGCCLPKPTSAIATKEVLLCRRRALTLIVGCGTLRAVAFSNFLPAAALGGGAQIVRVRSLGLLRVRIK